MEMNACANNQLPTGVLVEIIVEATRRSCKETCGGDLVGFEHILTMEILEKRPILHQLGLVVLH